MFAVQIISACMESHVDSRSRGPSGKPISWRAASTTTRWTHVPMQVTSTCSRTWWSSMGSTGECSPSMAKREFSNKLHYPSATVHMPCTLVYVGVSNRLKAWRHDSCALYGRSASTSSKQSAHGSHHYPRSWNRQTRWHLLHYLAVSFLNICVQIYGTWMEWLSFSSVPFKVQASEFKPWFAFFAEKKQQRDITVFLDDKW